MLLLLAKILPMYSVGQTCFKLSTLKERKKKAIKKAMGFEIRKT